MSDLTPKTGYVEISLEEKGNRFLEPFIILFFFAGALLVSPLLPGGSWLYLSLVVLAAIPMVEMCRGIRSLTGATVRIGERTIQLLRNQQPVFTIPWHSISRIEVGSPNSCTLLGNLHIYDSDQDIIGAIPLVGSTFAMDRLLGQIRQRLPAQAAIHRRVRAAWGSRRLHATMGSICTVIGVAAWLATIWSLVAGATASWAFHASTVLFLGGFVALTTGITQLYAFFAWNRGNRSAHLEPIDAPFFYSLGPAVDALSGGTSSGRKRTFRYPVERRKVDILKVRRSETWLAAILPGFIISASALLHLTSKNAQNGWVLEIVIILSSLTAVLWLSIIGWLRFREVEELIRGLNDEIEVEHLAIWVVRNGKRIPARVLSAPERGYEITSLPNLNKMRIPLEVGEETVWYDPSAMYDEEGLALFAQSKTLAK